MLIKQIKSEQVRINRKHSELKSNYNRFSKAVTQDFNDQISDQKTKSNYFHKKHDFYFNTQSK